MKPKIQNRFLLTATLLAGAVSPLLHAADIFKANNTTRIQDLGSWVTSSGGTTAVTAIGSTDVGVFDSTITGALSSGNLSANVALGGIRFTNPGGNVTVGVSGTAGASTAFTLNGNGTYALDMSAAEKDLTIGTTVTGGQLRWGSGNYGGITVASGRTLTVNANFTNQGNTKATALNGPGNIIFNGGAGSSTMRFSVTGGANVTLNGTGSWGSGSGALLNEILQGTVNIGNDAALSTIGLNLGGTDAANPTLTASGAARTISNAVNLVSVTTGNAIISGTHNLTLNGVVTNSGGNRTLSVNNTAQTTLGGGINLSESSSNRTLTLNGTGNVSVGAIANGSTSTAGNLTYSGSGILSLTSANSFGGTLTASSGTTRIDHTNAAQNATVSISASNAVTFGTDITTANFGALSGAGNLNLTNSGSGNVALSAGANNASSTYSGSLSGIGSLTKTGSGTLTLTNSGSFSGGTLVSAGTLTLNSSAANANSGHLGSGTVTLGNGATLTFAGNSSVTDVTQLDNDLTLSSEATATVNMGERSVLNSKVTGASNTTLHLRAGSIDRNDIGGNWTDFNGTLVLNDTNSTVRFTELTINGGSFNSGSLLNTTLDVQEATLRVAANSAGNTVRIGALTGSSSAVMGGSVTGGSIHYQIGAKNLDTVYAGTITNGSSSSRLTKEGTGKLTLTGDHNYSGQTSITGGTLALSGSGAISSSSIIVGANTTFDVAGVTGGYVLDATQILSGTGSVVGSMQVAGTLSPGNSPGTLSTDSQAWLNGGNYNWQIHNATGTAGTGYDTMLIHGVLDLSNLTSVGFAINLWSLSSINPDVNGTALNFDSTLSYSWVLASATGGISGFEPSDFAINTSAFNGTTGFANSYTGNFGLAVDGNNLVLNYTVVPEPETALLGSLGMLALLRRRRH
jgi:autotransporter-associated beta strand protein